MRLKHKAQNKKLEDEGFERAKRVGYCETREEYDEMRRIEKAENLEAFQAKQAAQKADKRKTSKSTATSTTNTASKTTTKTTTKVAPKTTAKGVAKPPKNSRQQPIPISEDESSSCGQSDDIDTEKPQPTTAAKPSKAQPPAAAKLLEAIEPRFVSTSVDEAEFAVENGTESEAEAAEIYLNRGGDLYTDSENDEADLQPDSPAKSPMAESLRAEVDGEADDKVEKPTSLLVTHSPLKKSRKRARSASPITLLVVGRGRRVRARQPCGFCGSEDHLADNCKAKL